ncbi:hypothetical protein [Stratiformator vulcanicus]|uniref:Uncharacterized protein n=1 Tax=Stratiformator vulcanicus TaxID=2527980 RepID=A0A517R037_9PLAN|nr:hypothetical protein [Stratiformator vulcanicus]QDT37259.1 hypothetical protein Pan189_16320 [Stratiformator vulcanicus]
MPADPARLSVDRRMRRPAAEKPSAVGGYSAAHVSPRRPGSLPHNRSLRLMFPFWLDISVITPAEVALLLGSLVVTVQLLFVRHA